MKCKDCPFFQSSGFGMLSGYCKWREESKTKLDGCNEMVVKK